MIRSYNGKTPVIAESAFIAENAVIIGDVTIGEHASVWYGAVLRGDCGPIIIEEGANVQDNCTIHCNIDVPCRVGRYVSVGHNAVLHSCDIGEGSLIGMNATVLSYAVIGRESIVGANALVTERKVYPDRAMIMGVPAKQRGEVDDAGAEGLRENAEEYIRLGREYMG